MLFEQNIFKAILVGTMLAVGCSDSKKDQAFRECPVISVRFSPNGGVTENIVRDLGDAKEEVKVQAFSFTSEPIGKALIAAHERGAKVSVILDRENLGNKSSMMHALHDAGVPIWIDGQHAIAHNKIIIIDGIQVFTGSANLSKAAGESNAENSVSIIDARISKVYLENWDLHKEHSKPYVPGMEFDE